MVKLNKMVLEGFKSFQTKTAIPFFPGVTAIVGENGSGKCVIPETQIQLCDGAIKTIEEIVEGSLKSGHVEELDDGILTRENPKKYSVLCMDTKTLKLVSRPVKAFVKRTSPEKLLKIRTRSGREITSTKYHPLFSLTNKGILPAKAEDLAIGKRIAVPRHLKLGYEPDRKLITLVDVLRPEDDLYLSYKEEYFDLLTSLKNRIFGTWKELADELEIPFNAIKGIVGKQAVNVYWMILVWRYADYSDQEILEKICKLKSKSHPKEYEIPTSLSGDLARFLGYLFAEGRITQKYTNQIRFVNGDRAIVEKYVSLANNLFGIQPLVKKYDKNAWDVIIYAQPIIKFVEKFGLLADKGTGDKYLGKLFFQYARDEEMSEFLGGLFDGDGYVSKNSIEITSQSKRLVDNIQTLLLRLEILSSIHKVKKRSSPVSEYSEYFTLSIYGTENARKFFEQVNFVLEYKIEALRKLIREVSSNPNTDLIEIGNRAATLKQDTGLRITRNLASEYTKIKSYVNQRCQASRDGLSQLVEVFSQQSFAVKQQEEILFLERLANSDILWDEIVEIKEVSGIEWVYDLCVEKDHNFVANNFFVHNSNVTDALQFVMGKRSSNIRAEKLAHLIFNGGEGKKPAAHAMVTLHIDNSDGRFDEILDERASEVTVGRKVTRGYSTYKFMGKNCQRDTVDRVLDIAGIDLGGHYFIKQEEVTNIVKKSPNDRRKMIDNVAGITEYDKKKEESLKHLEEIEFGLKEKDILLDEKKQYLRRLKREKSAAEKYFSLEQERKDMEVAIVKVREQHLKNTMKLSEEKLEDLKNKYNKSSRELVGNDEGLEDLEKRLEDLDAKIARETGINLVKDIEKMKNSVIRKKGEIDLKRQEIETITQSIEEIIKLQTRYRPAGEPKAVRALLSMENKEIYGTVSDLMNIPARFSTAISAAAAPHLFDVVVSDRDTAIQSINYLKRSSLGRARFLPLDKLGPGRQSPQAQKALHLPGVIDYAINLINYPKEYEKAFHHVFQDTLVSENLESVKQVQGVNVVTLEGDSLSRGGSMTGGSATRRQQIPQYNTSSKENKISELEKEIEMLKDEIGDLNRTLEEKAKEEKQEESVSSNLIKERKDITKQMDKLRDERSDSYLETSRIKMEINQLETSLLHFEAEIRQLESDLEVLEVPKEFDFSKYSSKSIEDLKRRKTNVLKRLNACGAVNMRSLEDYREFEEEFKELENKIITIRQEKDEILALINEIEGKKREKFFATLNVLAEHFQRLFKEIYGGGDATLHLQDSDDLSSGLIIRAHPPNKKLHAIDSLSGGEKTLTAIAFVLAMQELKPSPFYVMDEVDAYLDNENSHKIASLFRKYADKSQILMISHNMETVRKADRLYGITMNKGVSRIRSIELDDN